MNRESGAALAEAARASGLGRASAPPSPARQFLRWAIHYFSYHLFLNRRSTRRTRAAGFDLLVLPSVFHPRFFITSEFFASAIGGLDLNGKRVADVGAGTGILALAAARAGAARVTAVDINPNAVKAAEENARANGFGDRVEAIRSDLLSALEPIPQFDVILSSPPSFPGEPWDTADRAWHAGPHYRDITALFEQARDRLLPGGCMYVLFSSDTDLDRMADLIARVGFVPKLIAERSILIESFLLYELRQA